MGLVWWYFVYQRLIHWYFYYFLLTNWRYYWESKPCLIPGCYQNHDCHWNQKMRWGHDCPEFYQWHPIWQLIWSHCSWSRICPYTAGCLSHRHLWHCTSLVYPCKILRNSMLAHMKEQDYFLWDDFAGLEQTICHFADVFSISLDSQYLPFQSHWHPVWLFFYKFRLYCWYFRDGSDQLDLILFFWS